MSYVIPQIDVFSDEEHQASYHLRARFNQVNRMDLDNFDEEFEPLYPSDEVLIDDFIDTISHNIDDDLEEYNEEFDLEIDDDEDEKFREWILEKYDDDFNIWKSEKFFSFMWNTIWEVDGSLLDGREDDLYKIGIHLINYRDTTYVVIDGAGYNFYDAHWIPLFRDVLNWIKVTDNVEDVKDYYKHKIEFLERKLKELK